MTGGATLINPDIGSTRPGATASHRLSSADSIVAERAGVCAYVICAGTASEVTSTPKFRAAKKAVLTFGVIITSAPSVLCQARRALLLRSARLRCAQCDWRMTEYADRALRPAPRETGLWRSGPAPS